ncbi:hypothetical protein CUMW_236520 [Citrus unshiu]|nr:hypothetical protein CUMW_236520 [Citrus unshiu]
MDSSLKDMMLRNLVLTLLCRLSVTIPSVSTNVLGYGAFIGLYANMRYQLLCGFDRAVTNHFEVIGVALILGTALSNNFISCVSRVHHVHGFEKAFVVMLQSLYNGCEKAHSIRVPVLADMSNS